MTNPIGKVGFRVLDLAHEARGKVMRISAKGDYATRAMQELAMNYNRGPLPIEAIAERRHIPVRYLEQLLLILKRAGFLESKRGVKGGYYLAKPPNQVTVGEIIRLMDGSPAPIFCVDPTTNHEKCPVETICGFQSVWDEVHQVVANIIDKTTLEDICHRAMLKIEPGAASYRI
ncbi:MAG: Rrf2 family transcriptional regulator [candidate division NC10 bacterium]